VREIVEAVRAVTGRPIPTVDAPPRAGDPAALVAKVDRAANVLGWRARRGDLRQIVGDAWAWKQRAKASVTQLAAKDLGAPLK
jgi:UDP-glucose 4-epimerase